MSSRRIAKVSEAIRETVSSTVLFGLKDPRVKNVTVIRAEVTADLRHAKVYVSVRGDEKLQALTMHGLNAARGFIQAKVADRLQTKFTPVLQFVFDPGVHLSVETSAILRTALGGANAGSHGDSDSGADSTEDEAEIEDDEGTTDGSIDGSTGERTGECTGECTGERTDERTDEVDNQDDPDHEDHLK